jgi:hypothetical protein
MLTPPGEAGQFGRHIYDQLWVRLAQGQKLAPSSIGRREFF